jgi:hypothetical protein
VVAHNREEYTWGERDWKALICKDYLYNSGLGFNLYVLAWRYTTSDETSRYSRQ